jgi:hypothetical protein
MNRNDVVVCHVASTLSYSGSFRAVWLQNLGNEEQVQVS